MKSKGSEESQNIRNINMSFLEIYPKKLDCKSPLNLFLNDAKELKHIK